jgi:trehalose 6-phosphate phosphatase
MDSQPQAPCDLPLPPRAAGAGGMAVFLDVDGTLLDLSETPDGVHVPKDLISLLGRVHDALHGALALVSGRTVENLDTLFRPLVLPAAGLHGLEVRIRADAAIEGHALADELTREKDILFREFGDAPGVLIEDKGPCLALHYRRNLEMKAPLEAAAGRALDRLGSGFQMIAGNMVFELKPAAAHKGSAVRAFMETGAFRGRRPVMLGDDVTDEDAFDAVNALDGVSVCVGGRRPTRATHELGSVAAVHDWLTSLCGAAPSRSHEHLMRTARPE